MFCFALWKETDPSLILEPRNMFFLDIKVVLTATLFWILRVEKY